MSTLVYSTQRQKKIIEKIFRFNVVFVRDYRNISKKKKKKIFSSFGNVETRTRTTKTSDDDDGDAISFSVDVFHSMAIDFDLWSIFSFCSFGNFPRLNSEKSRRSSIVSFVSNTRT